MRVNHGWAVVVVVALGAACGASKKGGAEAQGPSAREAGAQPGTAAGAQAGTEGTPSAIGGPPGAGSAQAPGAASREAAQGKRGQELADSIMAQWARQHPDREWVSQELAKHQVLEPEGNRDLLGMSQGATYSRISEQDVETWRQETYKLAVEGSRVFHSADELGSTVAVSCDMCHPDAANTHPETYPKYQVQLGRVALLRDMINWCIEQPVRGPTLDPDDPKMRALEAYIYAQRRGTALNYGKR